MANQHLQDARAAKKDECYTQLSDIEKDSSSVRCSLMTRGDRRWKAMRRFIATALAPILLAACTSDGSDTSTSPEISEALENGDAALCDYVADIELLAAEAGDDGDTGLSVEVTWIGFAAALGAMDVPADAAQDHARLVAQAGLVAKRAGEVEQIFDEARDEARAEARREGKDAAETLADVISAPAWAAPRAWAPVNAAKAEVGKAVTRLVLRCPK